MNEAANVELDAVEMRQAYSSAVCELAQENRTSWPWKRI